MEAQDRLKRGLTVLKRSDTLGRWNERYVQLAEDGTDLCLHFMAKEGDSTIRKVILLKDILAFRWSSINFHWSPEHVDCCLFCEYSKNSTPCEMFLIAPSSEQAHQWADDLRHLMTAALASDFSSVDTPVADKEDSKFANLSILGTSPDTPRAGAPFLSRKNSSNGKLNLRAEARPEWALDGPSLSTEQAEPKSPEVLELQKNLEVKCSLIEYQAAELKELREALIESQANAFAIQGALMEAHTKLEEATEQSEAAQEMALAKEERLRVAESRCRNLQDALLQDSALLQNEQKETDALADELEETKAELQALKEKHSRLEDHVKQAKAAYAKASAQRASRQVHATSRASRLEGERGDSDVTLDDGKTWNEHWQQHKMRDGKDCIIQ